MTFPTVPLAIVAAFAGAVQEDPFQALVRTTEPLTAYEQLQTFHVPPGFEVQLFACEPDIQKPMNMAFDGSGRLWVTGSVEYPFPAEEGKGRDTIRILQDADGDGRAERISIFADGLNIPMGLYPYRDGVIAYSIPSIYFFRDRDGDGRADHRQVLYGPLGTPRDTHGMQNAFRRGLDGWLYVCHGFANESVLRGRDGSELKLHSGNTYRIRLDGGRVEPFSFGQVNPFGSTWLETGDLVTADCHSRPLTLVLREAYYSSFGKPHDGLGFGPDIMDHAHGSTGLAGAACVTSRAFPAEYRGNLLVGNVVTSRIHRDRLDWNGSSPRAIELEDFLTTDDPWFRPVDLEFGPDGALYVADFYNRVIGHYEVSLEHPGRDRSRARIWRIVYRGDRVRVSDTNAPPAATSRQSGGNGGDLTSASADVLIRCLADENLTLRMLATDQLSDRIGAAGVGPLRRVVAQRNEPFVTIHALWVLSRLGALGQPDLEQAAKDPDPLVRTHAMRLLAEQTAWSAACAQLALAGLEDENALVRRAAADAVSRHADPTFVAPVIESLHQTPASDPFLRHAMRIALREQLKADAALTHWAWDRCDPQMREAIVDVIFAIPTADAARWLADYLLNDSPDHERTVAALDHMIRHLSSSETGRIGDVLQKYENAGLHVQTDVAEQLLKRPIALDGTMLPAPVREWLTELAERLVNSSDEPREVARRYTVAAQIARRLKYEPLREPMSRLAAESEMAWPIRAAAARALVAIQPDPVYTALVDFVDEPSLDLEVRDAISKAIAQQNEDLRASLAEKLMRAGSSAIQRRCAQRLAESQQGALTLLDLIERGFASPRLLHDDSLRQTLLARASPQDQQRIEQLVRSLPSADQQRFEQVAQRIRAFERQGGSSDQGQKVFQRHCTACHQVAGQGNVIGPQLEGIGQRGLARVVEDVLDPYRNVDAAFRTSVLVLDDGRVVSGLVRRQDPHQVVLADSAGQEQVIAAAQIEQRSESSASIMPDNFAVALTGDELNDLLAYLMSLRSSGG